MQAEGQGGGGGANIQTRKIIWYGWYGVCAWGGGGGGGEGMLMGEDTFMINKIYMYVHLHNQ